jgi:hypothetical protein
MGWVATIEARQPLTGGRNPVYGIPCRLHGYGPTPEAAVADLAKHVQTVRAATRGKPHLRQEA